MQSSAPQAAEIFRLVFLCAVGLSVALRVYLRVRQLQHVAAHRNQVPSRFAEVVSLEEHQKAADYSAARSGPYWVGLLLETAVLLALTVGGGISALQAGIGATLTGLTAGVALISAVMLLGSLLELPVSIWQQFGIEARFGFNRMRWQTFVGDLFKQALLFCLLLVPLLYAVLWLMHAMGERWWLYVWLFWCSFNLILLWLYPRVIAPLFNKFTPLPEGDARSRIEALLQRCGFASNGLFVMDGSKRSAHGNAYFTGMGRNKRIVFFDTLLEKLDLDEVEAVLAHELGHFRHRHVVQRILLSFAGTLGALWMLAALMQTDWFFTGLGVPAASDPIPVALLLFAFALPAFLFPLSPLGSMLSRRQEYQADAYAAEHASAGALIRALTKLYRDNAATLTPDPVHSAFYDSHPPAALRIAALEKLA